MLTRKLTNAKTALGLSLLLGLVSQAATADEVVVVYGDEAVKHVRAVEAAFDADMREFVRAVDEDIKLNFDRELNRIRPRSLQLVANVLPRRG